MITGKFQTLSEAIAAVEKRFERSMPESLFLLSRAFCNHQARISARWPRPGHAYSSVEFVTSDNHNIATWVPDVGAIMWHATPQAPHGRPFATKTPGTYTVEEFSDHQKKPAPFVREEMRI